MISQEEHVFDIKNYKGSLDLLLSLVRDKKVDIFEINLIELADQYLAIIDSLQGKEIDLASDYLVMAATLLQIKSAMVLAPDALPIEVENDKQRLLQKLAEYKAFQEAVEDLKIKEVNRKFIHMKTPSDTEKFIKERDETKLDGHSSGLQIAIALRKMFERNFAIKLRQTKFENFTLTPAEQIAYVKQLFKKHTILTFELIFTLPSINHFVITLLAILDLARRQEIVLKQESQFGIITIEKGEEYDQQ